MNKAVAKRQRPRKSGAPYFFAMVPISRTMSPLQQSCSHVFSHTILITKLQHQPNAQDDEAYSQTAALADRSAKKVRVCPDAAHKPCLGR
jgi:hypothetical protein